MVFQPAGRKGLEVFYLNFVFHCDTLGDSWGSTIQQLTCKPPPQDTVQGVHSPHSVHTGHFCALHSSLCSASPSQPGPERLDGTAQSRTRDLTNRRRWRGRRSATSPPHHRTWCRASTLSKDSTPDTCQCCTPPWSLALPGTLGRSGLLGVCTHAPGRGGGS